MQVYDSSGAQNSFQLADGRTLSVPVPVTPDALTLDAWIAHAGRPRQIADLRQRAGGGRIVHLAGGGIASVGRRDTVLLYTVAPAPTPRRAPGSS